MNVLSDGFSGDALTESFFVIPSTADPSPPVSLKQENTSLKANMDAMKKRLEATERVLQLRKEQDLQLRDSIHQVRTRLYSVYCFEMYNCYQAQRVMGASMVAQRSGVDLSSLNINVPPLAIPGFNSGREAQYARRVRELEDELREVKQENAKQVGNSTIC